MNHARDFWKYFNLLSTELQGLRSQGFIGEGMYSKGLHMATGAIVYQRPMVEGEVPGQVCGGTWQRRKTGRKTAPRKRRKRKFDEEKVGYGREVASDSAAPINGSTKRRRPRKASTKKARELREEAALRRTQPKEEVADTESGTESDSGWESDEEERIPPPKVSKEEADALDAEMERLCGSMMPETSSSSKSSCPICTASAPTVLSKAKPELCTICGHVLNYESLDTDDVWRCNSETCDAASLYYNHKDSGSCGICGAPRNAVI